MVIATGSRGLANLTTPSPRCSTSLLRPVTSSLQYVVLKAKRSFWSVPARRRANSSARSARISPQRSASDVVGASNSRLRPRIVACVVAESVSSVSTHPAPV